jgi:dihydropteroate synthase
MAIDDLAIRYPQRARAWQLRTRRLLLGRRPLLMGIVNVTPDSFSDGGQFFESQRAIEHALQLVAEGAEMIDIGGESTRPYAKPVEVAEELQRVMPVVEAVVRASDVVVSIDTSKAAVAAEAVRAGAEIINDITACTGDPGMLEVARRSGAGLCLMHMQGTPQTMQDAPAYGNVVEEIYGYLAERSAALLAEGVERERICVDPGIGFGKTHQHNLKLAACCDHYHALGYPVLVGASRKGFIGKVIGSKEADRTLGSVGVALALARQGVQILRVHNVRAVREALLLFEAVGGIDGRELQLQRGV